MKTPAKSPAKKVLRKRSKELAEGNLA